MIIKVYLINESNRTYNSVFIYLYIINIWVFLITVNLILLL